MSIQEAARVIGVTIGQVRKLVKDKRITATTDGDGLLSLTPSSVEDYAKLRMRKKEGA
jgi:excisionase family DNA binding protein